MDTAGILVHVTSMETTSGITEYRIRLTGREEFEGDSDELTYQAPKDKPDNERRQELTDLMKMGLMLAF